MHLTAIYVSVIETIFMIKPQSKENFYDKVFSKTVLNPLQLIRYQAVSACLEDWGC